jgi:hypothetical protein
MKANVKWLDMFCTFSFLIANGCSGCEKTLALAGDTDGNDSEQANEYSDYDMVLDDYWDNVENLEAPDALIDGQEIIDEHFQDLPADGTGDDGPENPCCVVSGEPVVVDDLESSAYEPVIQWTGEHYGISWCQTGTPQMSFRFMTVDGEFEGEAARHTPFPDYSLDGCDMVWNSSMFALSFFINRAVDPHYEEYVGVQLVSQDGEFMEGNALAATDWALQRVAKIDWDGMSFGVSYLGAWYAGGNNAAFLAKFSDNNEVLQQPDAVAYITPSTVSLWVPEFLWIGDRYEFFFPFEDNIFTITTDRDGHQLSDPFGFFSGTMNESVIVNACRDDVAAAVVFHVDEYDVLRFGRSARDGTCIIPDSVVAYVDPTSSTVAFTGSNYGICWCDSGRPYFGMVDMDGHGMGENILVYESTDLCGGCYTVWSNTEFGLVWWGRNAAGTSHYIYAARIRPAY